MDIVNIRDPQSYALGGNVAPMASVVAGAASSGAVVTGVTIDRFASGVPASVVLSLMFEALLAAGKTLSLTNVAIQHSADGQNWSAYTSSYGPISQPGVIATGPAGGGTVRGTVPVEVYLGSAFQYVRVLYTPTLSAANTDTATVMVHARYAGFRHVPAP